MSTKVSLFYNDRLHLYQECFDETSVYLKYEDDHFTTTHKFTLAELVGIGASTNYDSLVKQANISDSTIAEFVRSKVMSRKNNLCPFTEFHATTIFGHVSDNDETQVKKGIEHYTQKRDQLKAIVEKIQGQKTRYIFGLEELI